MVQEQVQYQMNLDQELGVLQVILPWNYLIVAQKLPQWGMEVYQLKKERKRKNQDKLQAKN